MIDIGNIFAEIELDLVRNLKGELSGDNWRTQRLRALKQFQKRNMEIFNKYPITEEAKRQIEQAYLQAGYKTQAEAKKILGKASKTVTSFSVSDRRLKALIDQLNSDLTNAQTAAVRMMNDVYKETIAKAQVAMATNLYTMYQAVDMATHDFLSRGINCIQYANGARVNIASYAEMALRTSTRRATLIGEGAMRAELGQNLVYVSQYGACSDTCLPWQGQVYWDDVYTPGAKPDEKYPRLSEAIGGGLFHPNCRHKSSTWYPGVSKIPPLMDEETVRQNAQLESQQRYNERQIRKYKRMEEGSLDPVNQAKYANKVKQWQARQRQLISDNPDVLRRDYSREGTKGVGLEKKLPVSKPVPIEKSGLTHQPLSSTTGYTGTESSSILNELLRYGEDTRQYSEVIQRLDENMETVKNTTTLYRGVGQRFFAANEEILGINSSMSFEEMQQALSGKVFTDKGYMSTTHTQDNDYGEILMKIEATPGTKALWTGNDEEREVILGRGQSFKIKRAYREKPGDSWSRIVLEMVRV